ncbi:MAG: hypothetical protein ABIK36_06310 [Pseudomonadota bacterium]
MQGDDRLPIVEFLSRTIARFTDTRPRSEKELKKGFLISPSTCDNSVSVECRTIWRHYTYQIEILFRIDNAEFKQLDKRFFDTYSPGNKLQNPSMIYVSFERAAGLRGSKVVPLIHDAETQAAAFRHIEANCQTVFEWVRAFANSKEALKLYHEHSWLWASWYTLVFYVLIEAVHGKEAAVSYAKNLDAKELPQMMAAMAQFLKVERP